MVWGGMEHNQNPVSSLAIGGMIALAFAMGIGRFIYTPILPFMVESIPLPATSAGLIASANYLGYLVGALVAALDGLPGSKRFWFLGGFVLSAATTALMGLIDGFLLFSLVRFLSGVASALVLVFSASLIFDRLILAGRTDLAPFTFAGVGIGIAFSALLVAVLSNAEMHWKAFWLWSGGASLIAAGITAWLIPSAPEQEPTLAANGNMRAPRLVRLIIGYGLFGFGYVITATFINTMVRTAPQLQFLESSIWMIVGLAGIPSVAFWSWAEQKRGAAQAISAACIVEAIGVGLSITGIPAAIIVGAIFLGGTFLAITAIGFVYARTLCDADPRRIVALMTAAFGLGQVIGPGFAGYAFQFGDSFTTPSLVALLALVVAAGLIIKK